MKIDVTELDIFYISYDEPNAEENWADLLNKVPGKMYTELRVLMPHIKLVLSKAKLTVLLQLTAITL